VTRRPQPRSEPRRHALTANRLLAALPEAEHRRLANALEFRTLPDRAVLHAAGERIHHVYFPTAGVFSVVTALSDGTSVEAATVGDEGVVGVEALLGDAPVAAGETIVQVPDAAAWRMTLPAFRREVERGAALAALVGGYAHALLRTCMQSAACNARHAVQERCAKWLLLTHDRIHSDTFALSHDLIATMLGATRPTVTAVARTMRDAGLIGYRYGRITIHDRPGLEEAAAPCYGELRAVVGGRPATAETARMSARRHSRATA
jgi:CRP-like cAMP-binding protein